MRGSNFVFDFIDIMYYQCNKVNFKCGDSYIDSTDWLKKKKATINPKNDDNRCFQYAITNALDYDCCYA